MKSTYTFLNVFDGAITLLDAAVEILAVANPNFGPEVVVAAFHRSWSQRCSLYGLSPCNHAFSSIIERRRIARSQPVARKWGQRK
jgi:hypothetical protein